MSNLILNLAGGKIPPLTDILTNFSNVINLDISYEDYYTFIEIEKLHQRNTFGDGKVYYLKHDAFDFLERTLINFDAICVYRFLEHVSKNNIQYFIYLLSNCTKVGGFVDIIVPDAKILAKMLLEENVDNPRWESDDLLITYELVADQPSPHLSIWTKDRLIKLFEREGNFSTISVEENFTFDGRNIYIRYKAVRKQ